MAAAGFYWLLRGNGYGWGRLRRAWSCAEGRIWLEFAKRTEDKDRALAGSGRRLANGICAQFFLYFFNFIAFFTIHSLINLYGK